MRLLALLGIEPRLQRMRAALGEGSQAAEDRAQLLRLAWEDEKQRLKLVLVLVVAVIGLTTVTVALVSVAVVVHFWDTPQRITAAWSVAGVWLLLWVAIVAWLFSTLRGASESFGPAGRELGRDWQWLQRRIGRGPKRGAGRPSAARPASQQELLARIDRQRQRVEPTPAEQVAGVAPAAAPVDQSNTAVAMRLARQHPVAAAALAAGTIAVIGPRRLVRWAVWLVPVLLKMR